ncbi:DUF1214 domain-containing protein [Ruegeria sp. 1NDH52C]|uniref:DUF1214 domain-containing protein n=1 Tax=Ruegeria alba TaxID=2916756 RepID=A0ABS9P3I5_9RHOB|nr:DUF1214 domain-containing protein [Ruegeria alba]MCG6560664.1 DUF1214 domain-containing protein [Ruegeria alba]
MKRSLLTLMAVFGLAGPAAAEIPDIDSSGWSVDPVQYGMTAGEYINAETNAFFLDFLKRAGGVNIFAHFTGLTTAADRWVVSPNVDTIYSIAIVNTRNGFTLKLPQDGDRFMSVHIIDQDHTTPYYLFGGGEYTFAAGDFRTDFIGIGIRTGTDGSPEDVARVVEVLQPEFAIENAAPEADIPQVDIPLLEKVRGELVKAYAELPNSFGAMVSGPDEVKDWEYFTYVTAGAWGLGPDSASMYAIGGPEDAKANVCYTATFPKVPAKEFFSITLYGPEFYLMSDRDNIVSSTRSAVTNADGSFDVVFGGEECRSLAPNYAYTPEDGWSFLMRAYGPDVEAFKAYQMPEVVPAQ